MDHLSRAKQLALGGRGGRHSNRRAVPRLASSAPLPELCTHTHHPRTHMDTTRTGTRTRHAQGHLHTPPHTTHTLWTSHVHIPHASKTVRWPLLRTRGEGRPAGRAEPSREGLGAGQGAGRGTALLVLGQDLFVWAPPNHHPSQDRRPGRSQFLASVSRSVEGRGR